MLRWAIAGTSFISETMAAAIASSPGSQIAAVSGRDLTRLADFAARHGIGQTYASYDQMLANQHVDVVYIGLPNHLHAEAVIKATAHGKMILSEKSLTTALAEAEALAAAVRAADVFFMEGLMYLNHPLIAALGDVLRSGRLGRIRAITGYYAADIWQVANPKGMGTIFNLGCYPASLLHYVMQTAFGPAAFADRISSGFGIVSPQDGNIADATLALRFGNGVLATLQSTDSYGMDFAFTVAGERGMLRCKTNPWLPVGGENRLEVQLYGTEPESITVTSAMDAFQHQVACVEACHRLGLKQAARPAPHLADSLEIMALLTEWHGHCVA